MLKSEHLIYIISMYNAIASMHYFSLCNDLNSSNVENKESPNLHRAVFSEATCSILDVDIPQR